MHLTTAEMVQKTFENDLAATFSVGDIVAMTKVEMCGIDDEIYVMVDRDAMLFVARLLKDPNGKVSGALVYKKSLAKTMEKSTC